jgi:hypothetical protein
MLGIIVHDGTLALEGGDSKRNKVSFKQTNPFHSVFHRATRVIMRA